MDHRDAVFGECVDDNGAFDPGRCAERLLLFQRVILRSNRLTEIPILARAFGVAGLMKLLNSEALGFDCNAYGLGNLNPGGKPRPFSFDIQMVQAEDQGPGTARFLKAALDDIPGLRRMERVKLENAVERRRARLAANFGSATLTALRKDLAANSPSFHAGAVLAASEIVGAKIRPADLTLEVHLEEGTRFTVESNLMKIGLDEERAHKVIEGAVLAVAVTEQKIEQMEAHKSICTFRDQEVLVLREKIRFAWDQLLPEAQVERLARVLKLDGFPDFSTAAAENTLDYSRLIEARESPECVLFRQWLRNTDTVPDEKIAAEIRSIRAKLGTFAKGVPGKILRLATTSGLGFIPVVGQIAGPVASAIDSFVVEKVLPYSGPVAFLDNSVRSILRG